MEYRKVTLPNGLRILVSEMPETRSVSLAVYVGVGSRIETKDDAGTSHFLEHMVFKGSAKRPTAADISQVIESKGGVVNASTDKEVTVFWSRVPARHYLVALDVIADLIRDDVQRDKIVARRNRSEEHTSELQSLTNLVCRLLLEKKKKNKNTDLG